MKKLLILSAIAASGLFYTKTANAQISVHVGFNAPVTQPEPVVVEEVHVSTKHKNKDHYFYLPEVEAYYCVPRHCYYYNDGKSWVSAVYLPGAYHNYNWQTAVRYEVRESKPYMRHDFYKSKWGGYAGDHANWSHRFDNRYNGDYAYSGRDNQGWGKDKHDRDNRDGKSNQNDNQGSSKDKDGRDNKDDKSNQNANQGGRKKHKHHHHGKKGDKSNPNDNQTNNNNSRNLGV